MPTDGTHVDFYVVGHYLPPRDTCVVRCATVAQAFVVADALGSATLHPPLRASFVDICVQIGVEWCSNA